MKATSTDICRYCTEPVNLHDSGVTYKDGTCAHDSCHDSEQFRRENAMDTEGGEQ